MATAAENFIIGWQEWLALPDLGLPAIKAKIDTGARTSALHAFLIEPFGTADAPMVRFGVHPIPGRLDVAVFCSAPVIDRREVTSSNGEKDTRFFIRTPVLLGDRTWPIEIGLTNRESMSYRMLLGRQAIRDDMMVDAATSFRQPRLGYRLYRGLPRTPQARRPLRIALIARDAEAPYNQRLVRLAARRGHMLELLALDRLALSFAGNAPGLALDGAALAHYDAVAPRVGLRDGAFGAAVVRQLEAMGSLALNSGDALDRLGNRLATVQTLVRHLVNHVIAPGGGAAGVTTRSSPHLRVAVIGEEAVAMLKVDGERTAPASLARHRAERRLAEHAAAALGLGLAGIEIDTSGERPAVSRITARPALARFERTAGENIGAAILDSIEARLRDHRVPLTTSQ